MILTIIISSRKILTEPFDFTVNNCQATSSIEGGKIVGSIAGYTYSNSSISLRESNVKINGNDGSEIGGNIDSISLEQLH